MVAIIFEPRAIFLKGYKTASTSVEAGLVSAFLGLELTEQTDLSLLREGVVSSRGGTTRRRDLLEASVYSLSRPELVRSFFRLHRIRNHSTPDELRNILGKRFWSSSQKVVGVRNPFDLVASDYFWRMRRTGFRPTFAQFVASYQRKGINDTICRELDDSWNVIRFENLQEDTESVARKLKPGVVVPELPRFKTEYRAAEFRDYRNLYGPLEIEKISQVYSDWLRAFGYEF